MRVKTWSLMTLFLILLGLAVYLVLVVRRTAGGLRGATSVLRAMSPQAAVWPQPWPLRSGRSFCIEIADGDAVPRGAAPLSQKAASPIQSRKSWLARLSEGAGPAARGNKASARRNAEPTANHQGRDYWPSAKQELKRPAVVYRTPTICWTWDHALPHQARLQSIVGPFIAPARRCTDRAD